MSKDVTAKFLTDNDDGIGKAEDIITKYGGTVSKTSIITPPKEDPKNEKECEELWEAIHYLLTEWDYGLTTTDRNV